MFFGLVAIFIALGVSFLDIGFGPATRILKLNQDVDELRVAIGKNEGKQEDLQKKISAMLKLPAGTRFAILEEYLTHSVSNLSARLEIIERLIGTNHPEGGIVLLLQQEVGNLKKHVDNVREDSSKQLDRALDQLKLIVTAAVSIAGSILVLAITNLFFTGRKNSDSEKSPTAPKS
jgi:hypothetical protein